jgi:NAD(P)-dependent dehydrogenase (short-subunit alcohol dehydrogenase family)
MRLKPINEQVVVVMGASSGIGRATARLFAAKGAKVVVAARNKEGLETLVGEIQRGGGTAVSIVADVADPEQVKRVAEKAVQSYGRLDTWAHVAAVAIWATVEQTRPEELRRLMEVNLLGQMYGAQAALPYLRQSGGALVHVTSIAAKVALPLVGAYSASKHGVAGFLDTLRLELRREGVPVSVTQVMPAGINTPLFLSALTRVGVEPRPSPPVYEPDLVARAIVYAAEHPVRDLVVGGSGVGLLLAKRLSPRLVDQILLGVAGFESQLTDRPKPDTAPNNLFAPTPNGNLSEKGDHTAEARAHSILTRLQETKLARVADKVVHAGQKVAGRIVNALFALRFRRVLKGVRSRQGGEGRGLPAPIVTERLREETEKPAVKLPAKKGLRRVEKQREPAGAKRRARRA